MSTEHRTPLPARGDEGRHPAAAVEFLAGWLRSRDLPDRRGRETSPLGVQLYARQAEALLDELVPLIQAPAGR